MIFYCLYEKIKKACEAGPALLRPADAIAAHVDDTEGKDLNFLKIEQVQREGSCEVKRQIDNHLLTIKACKEIAQVFLRSVHYSLYVQPEFKFFESEY